MSADFDPAHVGRDSTGHPDTSDLRRWRRHLANERAEGAVYRDLAQRRSGAEREILLALAAAEARHEQHWRRLLGEEVGTPQRADLRTRMLAFFARHLGTVFVLALAQRAEARSTYDSDVDATATMAADERIHEEVVRALASRGRDRLSGGFRAAVFGANDGLVSNLALVLGVSATGAGAHVILATGLAGLLAGALSMGAGEYVSVSSQRELLDASVPHPDAGSAVPRLDVDANELALIYRARGMDPAQASQHADDVLRSHQPYLGGHGPGHAERSQAIGTGLRAAAFSFCFFAGGALIPVLPFLAGLHGTTALAVAAGLVGATLLATGAVVGLLSGGSPLRRAVRQLLIGYGAASITYLLGSLFGSA